MRIFSLLMLCLCFYIFPLEGLAQKAVIQFQNITFEQGLSDNRVDNVFQDKDGFLWLSTRLGIDKYNGKTTKAYKLLEERWTVNKFLQDKQGNIWAATTLGLYLFNKGKDSFELWKPQDEVLNFHLDSNIITIVQLNDGSFLCSSASGAILHLSFEDKNGEVIYQVEPLEGRKDINYVTVMLQDKNGKVWLGTHHGEVLVYDSGKFIPIQFSKMSNTNQINDMDIDNVGNLWIATNGNGLFQYNTDLQKTIHYTTFNSKTTQSINNDFVLSLFVDHKDNIWIGTDGGGLNLFNSEESTFTYYLCDNNNEFSISDNAILDISPGHNNIIWTSTVHGGISYFKNNLSIYNIPPLELGIDPRDKQDSRILEASNGNIWLTAGRNGLRRYNPKTGKTTIFIDNPNNENDLSGNNVLTLFEDNQNRIWIGTLYGGLNIFDTKKNKFLKAKEQSLFLAIFAIEEDENGNIWVGNNLGITVYNDDLNRIETHYVAANTGLSSNVITSLYKDVKGEMWVGTSRGLNVFQDGQFKSYLPIKDDSTSISGSRILSIAEDDDLSILVGTYGHGLSRYIRSSNSFKTVGEEQGLGAAFIRGIILDDENNIWCSNNLGLAKILPNSTVMNFGKHDGILPFIDGMATYGKSGYIYMAGSFGLSYFKANELTKSHSKNPNVFFNTLTLINDEGKKEIVFGSSTANELQNNHLTLPPDNIMFNINFSTSNFWDPQQNIYTYKLDGLHEQWQDIGNQELLSFSNLKPGEYKLWVKVKDIMGEENVHTASLGITVIPSFWEKSWVNALLFFTIILLLFSLYIWRITSIKKQKQKLEFLVKQKIAEIKTQNDNVLKKNMDLLDAEKANQKLRQKQLVYELDFKTNELTNHTLREVHKNNLLIKIKEDISKEAKQNDDNNTLKAIINLIDDSLNLDKDWDDFYNLFHEVHPNFISVLKTYCPNIGDRETRLCALIRLGFSSQHIATLFGISVSSVKVARHRLRKKLKISENDSFQEFFEKLIIKITS